MLRCCTPGILLLMLGMSGCADDKIVGRYARATCETIPLTVADGAKPPVDAVPDVSAPAPCSFSLPTASASVSSIATRDPAQASGNASSKNDSAPPNDRDDAMFRRTIVVTVRKEGPFNPTDRLESTDVTIVPRDARFESWDTIATAYTSINAGTVQLAQTRGYNESFTAGAPGAAPVSASGTVAASQSNTRTENFTAQMQAETLTASLSPDGDMLKIHRQGGIGVDLTGNTVVKVDLAFDGANPSRGAATANSMRYETIAVAEYLDSSKKPLPIRKIQLVGSARMGLPPGRDIKADVYLTYTLRHVLSGDTTYEEKDDVVRDITTGPVHRQATLISARDASEIGYGILVGKTGRTPRRLDVSLQGGASIPICFATRDEADSFIGYLRSRPGENPTRLANARIGVLRPELNPDRPPLKLDPDELADAKATSRCI